MMTNDPRSFVNTAPHELSDTELGTLSVGKMHGVTESRTSNEPHPFTGATETSTRSHVRRFPLNLG